VRLLASDQPGEVFGAAQALRRVLAADAMDLNDLAQVIETAAAPPPRPDVDVPGPDWAAVAYYCLDDGRGILREREREFVENMTTLLRWREPTTRQARWLEALADKVRKHAADRSGFNRGDTNSRRSR
jgi:hypothetical protein